MANPSIRHGDQEKQGATQGGEERGCGLHSFMRNPHAAVVFSEALNLRVFDVATVKNSPGF